MFTLDPLINLSGGINSPISLTNAQENLRIKKVRIVSQNLSLRFPFPFSFSAGRKWSSSCSLTVLGLISYLYTGLFTWVCRKDLWAALLSFFRTSILKTPPLTSVRIADWLEGCDRNHDWRAIFPIRRQLTRTSCQTCPYFLIEFVRGFFFFFFWVHLQIIQLFNCRGHDKFMLTD